MVTTAVTAVVTTTTIAATTTSSTTTTRPAVVQIREVTRDQIPVWMWVLLGISGAINLAVLGAFLNNRYRAV